MTQPSEGKAIVRPEERSRFMWRGQDGALRVLDETPGIARAALLGGSDPTSNSAQGGAASCRDAFQECAAIPHGNSVVRE